MVRALQRSVQLGAVGRREPPLLERRVALRAVRLALLGEVRAQLAHLALQALLARSVL